MSIVQARRIPWLAIARRAGCRAARHFTLYDCII